MPGGDVVLVAPLPPAPTGNGLAIRAGMFLEALAAVRSVDVVILPVAGGSEPSAWATERARRIVVVPPVDASTANQHVALQLADETLRSRLGTTVPLPARARLASPSLAADTARALGPGARRATVVSMREYLVPFGLTLARHLDAARTVIDLDDDAETLLAASGEADEAAAYGRLARSWLGDAALVTVASPVDAMRVRARDRRVLVETIPNFVRDVGPVPPSPGRDHLLYVGNLTYGPNVDAARSLVEQVLPALRQTRPQATVTLVGSYDARIADLAEVNGVVVVGQVPDVSDWYADADAVVVPLRLGSGTRIKVLEAFAHRRPVIATPAAVAGLEVSHGRQVLIGEGAGELAQLTDRVLSDPAVAHDLVAAAFETLRATYSAGSVVPLIQRLVLLS